MIRRFLRALKKIGLKYRKILICVFVIWGLFFLGLGTLIGGFFMTKASLEKMPDISAGDKILVVAPHIDDEIISSGGLIQNALANKAKVKIIYMTNGDNNINSIIKEDRNLKTDPASYIKLGEERMSEGKKATSILGLKIENLVFLGYPDKGLLPMLTTNFTNKYTARGSRLTYNPYVGTYRSQQDYTGENVIQDLDEIISSYKPNIAIFPNPLDMHPDHKATYRYMEKVLSGRTNKMKLWTYLVHYKNYPAEKFVATSLYLFPPSKMFGKGNWYSFDLTQNMEKLKMDAVMANNSQLTGLPVLDLRIFVRRNELFETLELL